MEFLGIRQGKSTGNKNISLLEKLVVRVKSLAIKKNHKYKETNIKILKTKNEWNCYHELFLCIPD